ncbi:MAG: ferredoxin [Oscillibacter sp.]|nr:ferredoxin [Oscillibacter sp.]
MKLSVDPAKCIGCGMCAAAVPEVFSVVGRVSTVLSLPALSRVSRVFDAANGCPVNAIDFLPAEDKN